MECFRHEHIVAVGLCKTCARAVCRSCARGSGYSLTCSPECNKDAADMHTMNNRAKKIYGLGDAKKTLPMAAMMWGLFAAMFGGFGIFTTLTKGETEWFLLTFGVLCLFLAIVTYRRTRALEINC